MIHFSFPRLFPAFLFSVIFAGSFALGGCSSVPRIVTEYRIDVQQGNLLTQEQVSQLRPGLTRDQVRYVLGTPLLVDLFHGDERWDYIYRLKKGRSGEVESRRLTLFFDREGKLERVDGDVIPEEGSAPQEAAATPPKAEEKDQPVTAATPQEEGDGEAPKKEAEGQQAEAPPSTSGSPPAPAGMTPEEAAQASKSRVLDLGSLEEGATLPPIENEPGFFGGLLEMIGF